MAQNAWCVPFLGNLHHSLGTWAALWAPFDFSPGDRAGHLALQAKPNICASFVF